MAAVIRLKRLGTKKKAHFRICVFDSRVSRDSRSIEEIGFYNPKKEPAHIQVNKERASYWLGVGAKPSDTVRSIFKREGILRK